MALPIAITHDVSDRCIWRSEVAFFVIHQPLTPHLTFDAVCLDHQNVQLLDYSNFYHIRRDNCIIDNFVRAKAKLNTALRVESDPAVYLQMQNYIRGKEKRILEVS